jgi:oligoribonuclease (3'-5' exoribonuclease)|tara:strand:+ start:267 stop:470 length:204 start_codon:yes stop_codon:yes gene_type:complete
MTLQEIQAAVMAGQTVHWENTAYVVKYAPHIDEFLIYCLLNDTCIGLTWKDGVTMNGKEDQFFMVEK